MTKKEFNNRVENRKNELLNGDAYELYKRLKGMHMFRYGGIEGFSFDKMLTETAQADILDIEFVDNIDLEEEISNL